MGTNIKQKQLFSTNNIMIRFDSGNDLRNESRIITKFKNLLNDSPQLINYPTGQTFVQILTHSVVMQDN